MGDEGEDDDGEDHCEEDAGFDEVEETVFAGAVDKDAGGFKGCDEGDGSSEHDGDGKGAFVHAQIAGGLQGNGKDDQGCGCIRHGLSE